MRVATSAMLFLGILIGWLGSAGSAWSKPILSIPALPLPPASSTVEFDVRLTNPSGDPALDIAGFQYRLHLPAASGYAFQSVTTAAGAPYTYVFAGNSLLGPNIHTSTGTSADAADIHDTSFSTVNPGQTVSLGRVTISTPANPQYAPIGISTDPLQTNLTLGDFFTVLDGADLAFVSGGLGTPNVTPEPASWLVFGLAMAGAAFWYRRRS